MLAELRRRRLLGSLLEWCTFCLAPVNQKPQAHHRLLIEKLEAVERGEIKRLIVQMPPGAAKSTYASVLFPPWFLARQPGRSAILASHTADLAEANSGKIIRTIGEFGPAIGLRTLSEGVKYWRTNTRGEVKSSGVGGPITGRRADCALIDDPVKSREDAESQNYRDKTWNWYWSDLYTRLKPGAGIVLIMTRWHEDDIAGRLLSANAGEWHVVKLPAEAGEDDPLGREPGEFLWSGDKGYDYGALLRETKATLEKSGAMRDWQSLYQQEPRPAEGALFQVAKINTIDAAPIGGKLIRAWDLAATRQIGTRDPDWTVGCLLQRSDTGAFIIHDIVRLRGSPDEVESAIVSTAARDGRSVTISIPQDPGQAGVSQVLYLTRKLQGYKVDSSRESGDKATRAAPVASQCNVGNLSVVRAGWNRIFLDELGGFPSARHDDVVDALSRAFAALIAPPAPPKAAFVPYMR